MVVISDFTVARGVVRAWLAGARGSGGSAVGCSGYGGCGAGRFGGEACDQCHLQEQVRRLGALGRRSSWFPGLKSRLAVRSFSGEVRARALLSSGVEIRRTLSPRGYSWIDRLYLSGACTARFTGMPGAYFSTSALISSKLARHPAIIAVRAPGGSGRKSFLVIGMNEGGTSSAPPSRARIRYSSSQDQSGDLVTKTWKASFSTNVRIFSTWRGAGDFPFKIIYKRGNHTLTHS